MRKRISAVILAATLLLTGCYSAYELNEDSLLPETEKTSVTTTVEATETQTGTEAAETTQTEEATEPTETLIDENGSYTTKDDVALYIYTYGCLPGNFITKNEARDLGWDGGSLEPYAPGMCIGGDYFGNYEGLLPDGDYRECDIDTLGADSRGAKRLIFTEDGQTIYYTDDHYASFTLLYGEE